jgi:hypothetical protein
MKNKTAAAMIASFYDAASKTIFKMVDNLKGDLKPADSYYDYQAKKVLSQEGEEVYMFGFAMITKNKKLRDDMWKTMEAVTKSDSTVDAFLQLGGEARAYKIQSEQ